MTIIARTATLLAAAALVLTGCTRTTPAPDPAPPSPASSPPSAPPSSAGPASALPVGRSGGELTVNGQQRTYRMYRPASLPATGGVPLVVVLHGAVGTGAQAEDAYGWNAQADTGGFLVAYPDGIRRAWNVSPECCGVPARDGIDDVGFIEQLVAAVGRAAPVDPRRVYATGISNGAMLSYRLACDTKTFAAIGPVAGTMISPCPRPEPISIIHIHGTQDRTIPYAGGTGRRENAGQGRLPVKIDGPPVPRLLADWRATAGCPQPVETRRGVVTTAVAACPDGRAVQLITIAEAGHQWPGGASKPGAERLLKLDPPSRALRATPTIWEFFKAHPKPS